MATLERTKSFLQARENFSEKNYKEEYEASQRELNILKTKVETNSKKMEDYKLSMENKIYLLTEEHKAEKESFEKLKQEYEGHITSMENILQFQENEQAKLQQCLDDTEDDASNYLDQIDDLKKQLEELNKDVDNLHAENHKLFDMTAQLQDENVRLQNELNESEESLELHKQQVRSKLASTLEEFQQQMTEGNAKSSQKDLTIFQLNEELERVAAENVHLRISVAALNDQVGSLEALLVEQERDHLRIKTLHSSNEFNISRLSSKYESVQQQLDLKSRSSDAAESKAEKLEAQLATANAELANSKERVKELESQLKDVQAKSITDRTNLSNKLLTALDDWNDRIAFVNNQLVQKDETIASQKKQLAAKLSELYNVRQELNKLKNASNGSTTVTPIGSPSKGGGADVSDQDTPTVAVPQRQMSNTWTQLKNQLADYQLSSPAATAGGVATQFIPPTPPKPSSSSSSSSGASSSHAASREIKRSPSSKWTLNGLNNGQPARAPSALEEESALPPPPVPRYALSRSASAASTSSASLQTPTKSAATSAAASSVAASAAATVSPAPAAVATAAMASPLPSSGAASSPAAPHSSMGASVTVTSSSRPQLHKAQSVILNPRATSPSRNKSPERTRSTMNLSGTSNAGSGSYTAASNYMNRSMGAGAAAAAEARAKSPARLSKSASMGTDKFR